MNKIIEIVVSPKGELKLETKGFVGESCREASKFLEASLGSRTSEQQTTEYYHVETSPTVQTRPYS